MELNTKVNATRPEVPYVMVQTVLTVPFKADPEKLQRVCMFPKNLKPYLEGEIGWLSFVKTAMPALREPLEGEPADPDMTEFQETAFGMHGITPDGKIYGHMPIVALDRQTAGLRRGILRNISITQVSNVHPMLKGFEEFGVGTKIMGISYRPHGEMIAKAKCVVTRKDSWENLPPAMKCFAHLRYLKDPVKGFDPYVVDVPLFEFTDDLTGGSVWRAKVEDLQLGGDFYDKWKDLGAVIPMEAYIRTMGYCYGKDSFVTSINEKGDWKWY